MNNSLCDFLLLVKTLKHSKKGITCLTFLNPHLSDDGKLSPDFQKSVINPRDAQCALLFSKIIVPCSMFNAADKYGMIHFICTLPGLMER